MKISSPCCSTNASRTLGDVKWRALATDKHAYTNKRVWVETGSHQHPAEENIRRNITVQGKLTVWLHTNLPPHLSVHFLCKKSGGGGTCWNNQWCERWPGCICGQTEAPNRDQFDDKVFCGISARLTGLTVTVWQQLQQLLNFINHLWISPPSN